MRHVVWLFFVLLAVAIIGIGSAIKLSAIGPEVMKYEKEWVTALLQAGLIAVLGAVTTAVLELFKSGLQQSKDRSKLQLDAHSELRSHYQKVKLIRRSYQATQTLTARDVQALNEVQLALEGLRDDSGLFGRSSAQVRDALSRMERYLNHLANDAASDERTNFQNSKPPDQSFKVFSHAYSMASTAMRLEIAPPSLWARIRFKP
ncbi:hypothetical protein LJR130_006974 [Variovorax sp. LjRoot130]|uniref:hypothetical protein n=1 Tax=Variovorax sp. LjRoot130 TaxID=3342261 RepID=UPI003ECEE40E